MDKFFNIFINRKLPLLVFISILFITGICFGAIAVKTVNYSIKQDLFNYFNSFIRGFEGIEYDSSNLIGKSIKFNIINMLLIWFFAITFILTFFIPVLIFFRGFVLGFTVGFLINQYDFQGVLISIVTVFPQNILIIPAYLLAGLIALSFTGKIFKYYRGLVKLTFNDFIDFTLKMGLLTLILLGGSFIETYISPFLFEKIIQTF